MTLHMKLALVSLSCVLLIQVTSCGASEAASWTCVCAAHPLGEPNSNSSQSSSCSSSCHCLQDENGATGSWNCSCTSDKARQEEEHTALHDGGCFTSCNCTSGGSEEGRKPFSSKTVIATLLVCVVLTTIAFVGTTAYYLRRKDALSPHSRMHSFDKYSSWSSRSNLVSHRSSPLPQLKPRPGFSVIKGFLCSCPILCRNESGPFPGIVLRFSYAELEQATGNFSDEHLIGVGGTSKVYRGQLGDGKVVAVKKLRPLRGADEDYEFLSEIELLSRLNHCHVVPLLGYCSESHHGRLLVFELMPNGNLRECLDLKQGRKPMAWQVRVAVALGVARGLEYLHEAAAPRVLHRDIKSTNILLDDKFRAKITDLGMAKCLMSDGVTSCPSSPPPSARTTAMLVGTFGYLAPEYAIVGKASLKSDVFSFGVVVLELITGRQPVVHRSSSANGGGSDESLVLWATPRLGDSRKVVTELPDPALEGQFAAEEMQVMAHLVRECLQWDPEARPSMTEVVQILSTIAPVTGNRRPHLPDNGNFVDNGGERRPQECSVSFYDHRWQDAGDDRYGCRRDDHDHQAYRGNNVVSAPVKTTTTTTSRSWEEEVDLTEPRLEKFTQPTTATSHQLFR
ncbi:receptor-like serine/threonine-protein kinase NCRK isoform X2 [Brachypodium distachyon]|uniref:receptor-like serine/threonine-protein kinase NCRK isoform X2 n=1 Tax=Brachypodium distachyon TaxID=15368 RepID=UPI00071D49BB|nr:receptor-like serine/threonine-protein kinase NCRK isoform X2 [Brachypodium distachyon]|eukprot:XP_014756526.1 receptor-like serine/threonine-protein kinase NCRK isoform X2 [Brachypodium distachyon]